MSNIIHIRFNLPKRKLYNVVQILRTLGTKTEGEPYNALVLKLLNSILYTMEQDETIKQPPEQEILNYFKKEDPAQVPIKDQIIQQKVEAVETQERIATVLSAELEKQFQSTTENLKPSDLFEKKLEIIEPIKKEKE